MSFTESAAEVLDRTETTLCSLMSDALKAQAYTEVAAIAAMAESVAHIGRGRSNEGQKRSAVAPSETAQTNVAVPAAKKSDKPSWIRSTT
jgi:hypothetical protein